MKGLFITFEGGEGAGKSTLIKRLADHLARQGRDVQITREPGGTASAEQVRTLLVNGDVNKWSSTAEALLNYAARDDHLRKVIRPALALGKTVLCDRFMDSTRAYQTYAGDCPVALVDVLEREVVGSTRPHTTYVLDLDPILGLDRAHLRGAGIEDRYERKGLEFHQRLRAGFLQIAAQNPRRCVVLDASAEPNSVWSTLLASLAERGHG